MHTEQTPQPSKRGPSTFVTAAPSKTISNDTLLFALLTEQKSLVGFGAGTVLTRGPIETLGPRTRDFFRSNTEMPALVGALPFDRRASDHLLAAEWVGEALPERRANRPDIHRRWSIQPEPLAPEYADAVRQALGIMAGEEDHALRKVVLARSLLAECDRPIDAGGLLIALHADPSVFRFLVPLPPIEGGGYRSLVGATPELLIARTGPIITSHPLAGSARRSDDRCLDETARRTLQSSEKDAREHALVVDFILDILAPHCRTLAAPNRAAMHSTKTMWHLGTRIEGQLRDRDLTAADLAAMLHPTPAVCGVPRERAAALISMLEPIPRDFYAGAVGWCDRHGDGAWYVSIRCAEIDGKRARLFAGAGIVPGSHPDAEVAETAAKFRTMLHALGVNEVDIRA